MSTQLDTPIERVKDVTEQKVSMVQISIPDNSISLNVSDYDTDGKLLGGEEYTFSIWNEARDTVVLPAAVETAARAFFQSIVTAAKSAGYIGAGTTTDEF